VLHDMLIDMPPSKLRAHRILKKDRLFQNDADCMKNDVAPTQNDASASILDSSYNLE